MHEIENALWDSIEKNGPDYPVSFIQRELANVVPCSPNKVLLSSVLTIIGPRKRLLPIGFNVKKRAVLRKVTLRVDSILHRLYREHDQDLSKTIELQSGDAFRILENIWDGFILNEGNKLSLKEMKSVMSYLLDMSEEGVLNLIVRTDRKIGRMTAVIIGMCAPDTGRGGDRKEPLREG